MNIPTITGADFEPLLPAGILMLGAIVLILSEVYQRASEGARGYQAIIGFVFSVIAGIVALYTALEPSRTVFQGFGVMDPFSSAVTVTICVGLAPSVLVGSGFLRPPNAA